MTNRQIVWANWGFIDGEYQQDAAIYVEDSEIVTVGSKAQVKAQHPDADLFGGDDYCLLPGFVNSHDHGRARGTVSLGVPDHMLEVWLTGLNTVPTLPPKLAAQYEGLQLIQSGVTTTAHSHNPVSFAVMFEEVPQTLAGFRETGVRVAMHPPYLDQNRLIYDDPVTFIASLPSEHQGGGKKGARVQ